MFLKHSVILIVDDSVTVRTQLRQFLNKLGFKNVVEATDGQGGMHQILEAGKAGTPISLVISDLQMPNMSGIEFLRMVKSNTHLAYLPFIIMTASKEFSDVVDAVNAGVSCYMVK